MSRDAVIESRGWKSLNLRDPAGLIEDNELASLVNFNIEVSGALKKRTGLEVLHNGSTLGNNSVRLLGHYLTSSFSRLLGVAGNKIYYSDDGSTWTLLDATTGADFAVQYADKMYLVRKNSTVLEYNGSALTAIAGSPTGTFCLVYKDRLFVLNTEASGTLTSRLYFSKIADFSAAGWPSTNFLDVRPGDGDSLVALAIIHDLLVVFKTRSTWGLYVSGLPDAWVLRMENPEIGCISKYTPREIEGFLYFVGPRGVYRTDGNLFENISPELQPVFDGRIVNLTSINIDVAAWWEDRYIVHVHPDPSTNRYFVYHLRTLGWSEWVFAGGILPFSFLEVNTAAPQKGLYMGDLNTTGRVFRFGSATSVYTDAGTPYTTSFASKAFDFGMPGLYKRAKWLQFEFDGAGNPNVTYVLDEASQAPRGISGAGRRAAHKVAGPGYFRTCQVQFSDTSSGPLLFWGFSTWLHRKRPVVKAVT